MVRKMMLGPKKIRWHPCKWQYRLTNGGSLKYEATDRDLI